jgi:hypothetical protein
VWLEKYFSRGDYRKADARTNAPESAGAEHRGLQVQREAVADRFERVGS